MTGGEHPPTTRPIWVAEDFTELKPENSALLPLEKALFCVEGVRSCDYFLAILSHRTGSEVAVDVGSGNTVNAPTSFFELELMAAALFRKPSFIYLHSGFQPSDKLAQFLELLRPIFPDMALQRLPEAEILRRVERLVKHVDNGLLRRVRCAFRASPVRRHALSVAPQALRCARRTAANTVSRWAPRCHGRRSSGEHRSAPARTRARRGNLPRPPGDTLVRYSRTDGSAVHEPGIPRIRAALGRRAWHLELLSGMVRAPRARSDGWLSCAGVAGRRTPLDRRRIRSSPRHSSRPYRQRLLLHRETSGRREIFDLALAHLDAVLTTEPENRANLLAIRGSIFLRLGDRNAAIMDYEDVARARKERGGGVYGEALNELGYALVLAGKKRTAWR